MKEGKRIPNVEALADAVDHRMKLLDEIQETSHCITEYLVENRMTEFFSINWKRLDRLICGGHKPRSKLD